MWYVIILITKPSKFFRVLADDRLSSSLDVTCPEMPITKRSLIDLPEDYTDLLNKATGPVNLHPLF